jgi:[acyl-carrier-protein] S-malonyltransferase
MVTAPGPKLAFVFPGQASQRAGMAAEVLDRHPQARDIFHTAGEVLGLDLADLCTKGDDALLTRTDVAQPALLTTSLAWLAAVRDRGLDADLLAGHSLGEFSAWVASGALDFEPAVRLVRRRGELMEEAGDRNPGGMLAVVGLADAQVEAICQRAAGEGVVVAANYNSPGQLVISGEEAALNTASDLAREAGGRTIPLRVSGAFHSSLMDDAAHAFAQLVAEASGRDPQIPVVANATAEPVTDAAGARAAMSRQMTSPVLWSASVRRIIGDGAALFAEIGPGRVLSKLIPRISADARCLAVGTTEQLEALVKEVRQ